MPDPANPSVFGADVLEVDEDGPGDQPVDGRTARALRTRAAVIDALLELIAEGDLRPTAPRIAERAGVSLRSVFQHFSDLDSLFLEAAQRQVERIRPLVELTPDTGPVEERIDELIAQRCKLYEVVTPVRRSARLVEPFNDTAHELMVALQRTHTIDVIRVFRDEIGDDEQLGEALAVASAWDTWDLLRDRHQLDADAAAAVMTRSLRAMLGR